MWKPGEIIDFAKDCISYGVEAVSLGGGEPFEYEGIFNVIDALQPITYLSVTTNGLPLLDSEKWNELMIHAPDKIHITIHRPNDSEEVGRVISQVRRLAKNSVIKPGVNLLVSDNLIEECRTTYSKLRSFLKPDQIILVPRRFGNTPSPEQLALITDRQPFQCASCLLGCRPPSNFVSISWDKKVNRCSYALGKQRLKSLTYQGLLDALSLVQFKSCQRL